jgi:hypothetical protein
MDLFVTKTGSDKAGNSSGARILTTIVDYKNEKIQHYIEHEVRDSEGDVIGVTGTYAIIELTPVEFSHWVTQQVIDASISRTDSFLNPIP